MFSKIISGCATKYQWVTALCSGNVKQTNKQTKDLRTEQKGKRKGRKERNKKDGNKYIIHKKFWEELIAYFSFIRHELHTKPKN
jgi:hypothetical protein